MRKTNYEFAKRQKELKKQKKNEEKRLRKLNKSKEQGQEQSGAPQDTSDIEKEPIEPNQ